MQTSHKRKPQKLDKSGVFFTCHKQFQLPSFLAAPVAFLHKMAFNKTLFLKLCQKYNIILHDAALSKICLNFSKYFHFPDWEKFLTKNFCMKKPLLIFNIYLVIF